jgi:hypothetical protein
VTDEITFSAQLTEAEFLKIQRAVSPRFLRYLPWLILGAFGMVLLTADLRKLIERPLSNLPGPLFSLFVAVLVLVGPRLAARKTWRTNASLRAAFSGSVSTAGITWQGAFGQGSFPWDALYGFKKRGEIVLVYVAVNQAYFLLPRFFASPADWSAACAMIRSNLQPR